LFDAREELIAPENARRVELSTSRRRRQSPSPRPRERKKKVPFSTLAIKTYNPEGEVSPLTISL
jgi:hypothetical protein